MTGSFEPLRGHRYVNLTTFRRSGEAVTTTVWFVLHSGRLYVTTPPESGKMKRLRNDSRVLLTPSNAWGWEKGDGVVLEGAGRPVEESEVPEAGEALRRKYRIWLKLFHLFGRREIGETTLEVRPVD